MPCASVTVKDGHRAGSIEELIVVQYQDRRRLADGILEGRDQVAPIGADWLEALPGEG